MVKIIQNSLNFVNFHINGSYGSEITNLLRVLMVEVFFFLRTNSNKYKF